METTRIIDLIQDLAPLETQEGWDCSGYQLDFGIKEIQKILLCVSVTENVLNQAIKGNYDLIIAHHPMFFIPFEFNKNIPIYSAHTNLDKAIGGTTDTLIDLLDFDSNEAQKIGDFLRLVKLEEELNIKDFINLLKEKLKLETLRVVNNLQKNLIQKIAFCAGSGADFLDLAQYMGADMLVTGDLKYHTALDSRVIIADIGHFESERPVLGKIKKLLSNLEVEVDIADEKSPFITY